LTGPKVSNAPVGQQPVEADRDTEAGQEVERQQDAQVGPAYEVVPQQRHGDQERQEGHDHCGDVDVAVQAGH
jgi:hypothetical protein